jgi:hypothetical protein
MPTRFNIQDTQIDFPYHYLPHVDRHGTRRLHRSLPWGLDYLCHMTFIADVVARHGPKSLLDVGCGDGRLWHGGWWQNLLGRLACNRLYVLNNRMLLRQLDKCLARSSRRATAATGEHLVVLANNTTNS